MPPRKRSVGDLKPLGSVFRALRKKTGLSQERLALDYDLDRAAVSSLERGKTNITFSRMRDTLTALGASWETFGRAMDQEAPLPPRKSLRRRR